LRLPAHC